MEFNFGCSVGEPAMSDEEFFGVDEKGYLKLYVGRLKPEFKDSGRKFKIKLAGKYKRRFKSTKPVFLNYNEVIHMNVEIEFQ